MIISKFDYSQNIGTYDEWHLKDLRLSQLNIITSKNAVGKTRTINVITALATMLSGKQQKLKNGKWDLVLDNNKKSLRYQVNIEKQKVVNESIIQKGKTLLNRSTTRGEIGHFRNGQLELQDFNPPLDNLTNRVRRDLKELIYLEDITHWAKNVHTVTFSNIVSNIIPLLITMSEEKPDLFTGDLGLVPFMLEELGDDIATRKNIIKDLNYVGYKIKDIGVSIPNVPNPPKDSRVIRVSESGLNHAIDQFSFSQGMHRVIAIIISINYLLLKEPEGTFIIDDFAEGLDFERATNLSKIIFRKLRNSKIQLILTSNERFLMNAVDIKYWNILERSGHMVKSFNYVNKKKEFNEFARVGLNNFDFFANQLYKG